MGGYNSLPISTRTGNPYLDEIDQAAGNAHAALSPGAQLALRKAGAPVPISDPQMGRITGPRPTAPTLPIPQESTQPLASSMPSAPTTGIQAPHAAQPIQPVPQTAAAGPAQAEMTRLSSSKAGVDQIHNPWARIPLQILAGVGETFAPRLATALPGTWSHHNMLLGEAENAVAQQQKIREDEEKAGMAAVTQRHLGAQADLAEAQAQALGEESKKNTVTLGPGQGVYDLKTHSWLVEPNATDHEKVTEVDPEIGQSLGIQPTKDGRYLVPNQALGTLLKPKSERGPKTLIEKAIADNPNATVQELQTILGNAGLKTERANLQIGGRPHQVLINSETGDTIKDLGESGEKPPTINVNAEQKPGKTLLDKAEATYRTAQQSANDLRNFISMAQSGNKVTAQALPLEGTLAIVTSQGVKRINRTEVEYNQAAGSLFDRIMGEVGKLGSGQPVPANILKDWNELANVMEKSSYQTYRATHDSAVKRYHLTDEEPLPGPSGAGGGEAQKTYSQANVDAAVKAGHGTAQEIEAAFKAKGYRKQ